MVLNKRDLFKYRKFISNIKNGTGDAFIDRCIPILVRFIETTYVSDESKMFDIDDLIQECMIKASSYRGKDVLYLKSTLKRDFNNIYESMSKANEYQFSEPVNLGDRYDEIDVDHLDLDRVFDKIKDKLSTEGQRKVVDCLRDEKDNDEIARDLRMRRSNVYELRKKVTTKIRKSHEFREYTEDSISKFYSHYQVFVLEFARDESSFNNMEDLLLRYWKNNIDSRSVYYYNSIMIHLLKFFYKVRNCCIENDSIYLSSVEEDINNIVASIKTDKLNAKMKDDFERFINNNTSNDHKIK